MIVQPFNGVSDFETQQRITSLYDGIAPFAPVLHQALTGVAGMWVYTAWSDGTPRFLLGAGMLKSPEAVIPIGQEVQPLAWVISDMVTHPQHRRQGVGRALLKYMAGEAFRNGGRILYLYTSIDNAPAIELYRATGFERLADQSRQAVFVKLLGEYHGAH